MLRFKPFGWLAFFVLIIFTLQKSRAFSIREKRSAHLHENIKFQPTPNLGKNSQSKSFISFFKWNLLIIIRILIRDIFFSFSQMFLIIARLILIIHLFLLCS